MESMTNGSDAWVVVPNWNGEDIIAECLNSLQAQSHPSTIVVVDNGSADQSIKIIETDFPDVVLIKNPVNLGFSGGVNTGIRYALERGADTVALFNNDAVADKDWLKHLSEALEDDPVVGIATGKLLRMSGQYLDSTGQLYSVWGAPFPRGRNQKDEGQFDSQTRVFGATGGATLYRATMLQEIGIFDERFFAYYEDDDISFRARLVGWEIEYVPAATALHHVSATSSKLGSFTRYHATKNIMMTYLKNMPGWLFWKYLPLFSLWMIRLAVTSALKGGGLAYARGFGRVLLSLPSLLKDRHKIQRSRRASIKQIDSLLYKNRPPRVPTISAST